MTRRAGGFTLIEVLIAVLVIAVGVLSLSSAQMFSLRSTHQGLLRSQATALANDMAERLRSNRRAVLDAHFSDLPRVDGDACVNFDAASDCVNGAVCSAAELALFDYYDVGCGAAKLLPSGSLAVDCDVAANPICAVRVGWIELADDDNDATPGALGVAMRLQP